MKRLKSLFWLIFFSLSVSLVCIGLFLFTDQPPPSVFEKLPDGRLVYDGVILQPDEKLTTYTKAYDSGVWEEDLHNLQCPIPMKDRVPNRTGSQCVYASIECLGRWAEEPKLMNPPLTSRSNCKSYSSPSVAGARLRDLNVKFEQVSQSRTEAVALIKKAMAEHRGCLFDVPGHAMVLCHYDEAADKVCWIDNSDRSLRVQTMTLDRFRRRWGGWILVVYADKDIIPLKMSPLPRLVPIIDRNNPQGEYKKDYIPLPLRLKY